MRTLLIIGLLCLACAGGCAPKSLGGKLADSFRDLTPTEEHFLGRGVAAELLGRYAPLHNAQANEYLNLLGQSLAYAADSYEHPHGGYHFALLDTDEINAFAAPGGFILVTRGLARCTESEDELAAVLAHEIAHVQLQHGMRAVKLQEKISAFTQLGQVGMEIALTPESRKALNDLFGDSVNSIVDVLVVKGYSRSEEYEADERAVAILKAADYAPTAMNAMLRRMQARLVPRDGFGQTHPSPADRITNLGIDGAVPVNSIRQERYETGLRAVL